jgi:hypothetical protein
VELLAAEGADLELEILDGVMAMDLLEHSDADDSRPGAGYVRPPPTPGLDPSHFITL